MMYRSEVTSPLSERNGQRDLVRDRNWSDVTAENELLLKMQRKMAGLDTQQRKVIKEYEQELEAMKNEIKKIRVDYDTLKQKNTRYRNQLKDKNDQLKKLQEQSKLSKHQHTDTIWSTEKTKLLARIKQLEVEKKQVDDKCNSLLVIKDENADLKREVESLRFRETLWMEEKERAELERKKNKELKDIMKYAEPSKFHNDSQPRSLDWSTNLQSSSFNFDDAWNQITQDVHVPFSSLPTIHVTQYKESDDLQDIRKSLNEAREELKLAKGEGQSKKDQFLRELKERDELQKTIKGLREQRDSDTDEVRHMITKLESKISTLESNCLTEVQNLVHNVDILKNELINSQQELKSLKEYSRQMEKRREEEKIQMLNESRELKLDLSCLRSEIRDKSQGSDRTDQSRSNLTDSRDQASEENFESHYSPLVGFVGSRCDYLKMKLDTLKKHLRNLDVQTKTVLNHSSIVDASSSSDTITNPNDTDVAQTDPKPRNDKNNISNNRAKNSGNNQNKNGNNNNNNDNSNNNDNENAFEDDGDIVVVTPRPHRNRYDQDMDMLIVENGQNIERLRLPSLEEEDDEEEEEDEESKTTGREEDRRNEENRRNVEVRPSPRHRERILTRVEEEDEAIEEFLSVEKKRASTLVKQVDSRFEKLERELEMQSRRRQMRSQGHSQIPMPAYHNIKPKSAH